MSRDEMYLSSDTVDDYHDHVVAISLRKLNNEVETNNIPSVCWSLCRVEFSIGLVVLQLCPIAKVTGFDIESNVLRHLGPPVVV
jgi:hypothetical protein